MLEQLPPEILAEIVSYVPTASAVVNLAATCRTLHAKISANDYQIFRGFVINQFPSIRVPRFWKDAARALASRSRAWDRRAFVARVLQPKTQVTRLIPDGSDPIPGSLSLTPSRQTIGYTPVIDSYEMWTGGTWSQRDELLAWGAGPTLMLRSKRNSSRHRSKGSVDTTGAPDPDTLLGSVSEWFSYPDLSVDQSAEDDILNVHILRPNQKQNDQREEIVLRRANGKLVRLSTDLKRSIATTANFDTGVDSRGIDCIDVCVSGEPLFLMQKLKAHPSDQ